MYLQNDLISLRALEPEDLDLFYHWENDTSLWHLGSTIEPYSRYIIKEYIASADKTIYEKQQLRLMMVLNTTGDVIGTVDLFDFDAHHQRAGIGVLVDRAFQRQGFGAMGLTLLSEYAFKFLHLNQLFCHVPIINEGSMRMVEKVGFTQSGLLRNWLRQDNSYIDVIFYQFMNKR